MSWTKKELRQSYHCNGELLKKTRTSRNWSQRRLAQHAGYSQRLISKAEAGGRLTVATLEVLAQALSTATHTVFPEELIGSPEALAKTFHYAVHHFQTEMFDRVKHFIDDEVIFHIHGDRAVIPFAGIYEGLDGFRDAIETFFRTMEIPEKEKLSRTYEYFTDHDEVIVLGETNIHPVGHPRQKPKPVSQLMRFRDRKLVHFEDRHDIIGTDSDALGD